jgi:Putative peptidoglycan binding domain
MMVAVLIALVAVAQSPIVASAQEALQGCTNPSAINFTPGATIDNGSCVVLPPFPMFPFPPMPPAVPTTPAPTPVGTIEITDPQEGQELQDFYQFSGLFDDASGLTINEIRYSISEGSCSGDGDGLLSGLMFNTGGSLAVPLSLGSLVVGEYCFTATALAADATETTVSESVNFSITDPSEVSIWSPRGTVNGVVDFEAQVTFGTSPELTNDLDWSVYTGNCDDQGVLVAGNMGDFNDEFSYSDGQFNATLDTSSWAQGLYCFQINPHEAGDVPDSVNASREFNIGFNTISGQKYEDVDGDKRLNYEIDQLVANYPIIATNEETGEIQETTTDDEGTYTFALPNGIWTISEGEQRGWNQIRAYNGWVLIDDREEGSEVEPIPLDCTIFVGREGEVRKGFERGKGNGCTFLNERVSESKNSSGTRVRPPSSTPDSQVLGAATSTAATCEDMYLTSYLREGQNNPVDQVVRLQAFLNAFGFTTSVTGTFDAATTEAVRKFQVQYLTEVLRPWNLTVGTGYVFKTTRATINNIICPGSEAVPTI